MSLLRAAAGEERVSDCLGTFFAKVIWPFFGLGSIPGYIWAVTSGRFRQPLIATIGFGVVVLLGFTAYYWLYCRQLRWVWLGPATLRISCVRREVTVPLTDVVDVRSHIFGSLIRLTLKYPTEVGQSFLFIPRRRYVGFGEHPVVKELRARVSLEQSQ